ncbi:hypothetical protein M885DRAFT_585186 [Pelagophyceae sp. CCMP2097]|nr:hypothetical protein M885DRAFT_585186 [Pelagophyceae sp. CCMP2097]
MDSVLELLNGTVYRVDDASLGLDVGDDGRVRDSYLERRFCRQRPHGATAHAAHATRHAGDARRGVVVASMPSCLVRPRGPAERGGPACVGPSSAVERPRPYARGAAAARAAGDQDLGRLLRRGDDLRYGDSRGDDLRGDEDFRRGDGDSRRHTNGRSCKAHDAAAGYNDASYDAEARGAASHDGAVASHDGAAASQDGPAYRDDGASYDSTLYDRAAYDDAAELHEAACALFEGDGDDVSELAAAPEASPRPAVVAPEQPPALERARPFAGEFEGTAGLLRNLRELRLANTQLRSELKCRDDDLRSATARIDALRLQPRGRGTIFGATARKSPADDYMALKKRFEDLAADLKATRRRERRAVELGSALRRRVADERARADAADSVADALQVSLRQAACERDRAAKGVAMAREAKNRCQSAAAESDDARLALEQQLAEAQTATECGRKISVAKLRGSGVRCLLNDCERRKLGTTQNDVDRERLRLEADHRAAAADQRATAKGDECLALRARLMSQESQQRASIYHAELSTARQDCCETQNAQTQHAKPQKPQKATAESRHNRSIGATVAATVSSDDSSDDEIGLDYDTAPHYERPRRPHPVAPQKCVEARYEPPASRYEPQSRPEPQKQSLVRREAAARPARGPSAAAPPAARDDSDARYRRLRATFNRVVNAQGI